MRAVRRRGSRARGTRPGAPRRSAQSDRALRAPRPERKASWRAPSPLDAEARAVDRAHFRVAEESQLGGGPRREAGVAIEPTRASGASDREREVRRRRERERPVEGMGNGDVEAE